MPQSAGHMPEQQEKIYQKLIKNGEITSSQVEKLLGVKQRRARAVLKVMVENGIIRKVGAAKNTKYVLRKYL